MKLASRSLVALVLLSAAQVSSAHEHTAPWLDETKLDGGLYVEVRHPRVLRRSGPFDVTVAINNLAGAGDVALEEVRYLLPGAFAPIRHPREDVLASRRAAYRRYKTVEEALHAAAQRGDGDAAARLSGRSQLLLRSITGATRRDRQRVEASFVPEVGSTLSLVVEIDVVEPAGPRTLRRTVDMLVAPPLPSGPDGTWFAGDQHLHTAYSIDAFFLNGTRESVADYAHVAQSVGLDWVIVSDHSNVRLLLWYRPILFRLGEREAERVRDEEGYLVLQGEEMGTGANGPLGQPAHVLAYPRAADSTGFLANPCPGLVGNFVNCEPEQVILDRINDNGGIAFIAHPFDSAITFAAWDRESGAEGWAGLEIFNSYSGDFATNDQQSVDWWYELLRAIEPPHDGALADRPGYPTRFPVGLGNSDAHEPSQIGATFTYCHMPQVPRGYGLIPREDLMDAFVAGRCVATNGPLVFGDVNGAGLGEVAMVPPGENDLTVTLQTSAELGPVSDYEVTAFVDGAPRRTLSLSSFSGFEATFSFDDLLFSPDEFVTLRAHSLTAGYVAIANPIWLEFPQVAP